MSASRSPSPLLLAVPLVALAVASCDTSQNARPVLVDGQTFELQRIIEEVHRQTGVPALAAAWVRSDGTPRAAVTGVRSISRPHDPMRLDDRVRLGAASSQFTAGTLLVMIRQRMIRWDSTVQELMAGIASETRPNYRALTLEQLLSRATPMAPLSQADMRPLNALAGAPGSGPMVRGSIVRWLLQRPPGASGDSLPDPNYLVAAHMADLAGESFDFQLVQRGFQPLTLQHTCGVSLPDTADRMTLPGHVGTSADRAAAPPGVDRVPSALAALLDVQCPISDVARFARMQVRALRGVDEIVNPVDIRRFYSAAFPATPGGRRVYRHTAGAVRSFAVQVTLLPDDDLAVVVSANAGFGGPACARTTNEILASLSIPPIP